MNLHFHKQRDHTFFFLLLFILILLLFFRYGLQMDIPRAFLSGVMILAALTGNYDEIISIAMCCIPLHEAVDFFYVVVACASIYVAKDYRRIHINLTVVLLLALVLWELLRYFTVEFSVMGFLVSVVPLIFLTVIQCVDVSNVDYAFVVRNMSLLVAAICLITLMREIVMADFNLALAVADLQRLGLTSDDMLLGSTINPNSLGIVCILSLTGLLQLRMVGQQKNTDTIIIIVLLVFGALTLSRTFLICLVLMVFFMILAQRGDFRKKLHLLCTIVLIAVTVLLLLNWLFPDVLQKYDKRFQSEDISSGRTSLMIAYHQFILDEPKVMLFGIGLQDFKEKLIMVHRVADNTPHNAIQEVLVAWGIPGFLLIVVFGLLMLQQSTKYSTKHALLNYIPLLIILAKSMAGQLLVSNYTMLALSYAYLSLCQDFRSKIKQ